MGDDPEDSEGLHDFRVPAGEDPLALPPRIWHVFSFGGAEAPGDEYARRASVELLWKLLIDLFRRSLCNHATQNRTAQTLMPTSLISK